MADEVEVVESPKPPQPGATPDTPSYKPRKFAGQYPPGSPEAKIAALPCLNVHWNQETQQVHILFKGGQDGEFKTWEFVDAILTMAKTSVEQNRKLSQMMALQAGAQEMQVQMQRDLIARKILEAGRR